MNLLGMMGLNKPLSQQLGGGPVIVSAPLGWQSTLQLVVITQSVVEDGFVQETANQVTFNGVVQPLSPKQIALKPEGERAWTWLQIHVQTDSPVKLNVNDRIMHNCRKYKVMGQKDYSPNGYVEYHAVEDFQP